MTYLNDFVANNNEFMTSVVNLEDGQRLLFSPLGQEYKIYELSCERVLGDRYIVLSEQDKSEFIKIFRFKDINLADNISIALTRLGITRVAIKKG